MTQTHAHTQSQPTHAHPNEESQRLGLNVQSANEVGPPNRRCSFSVKRTNGDEPKHRLSVCCRLVDVTHQSKNPSIHPFNRNPRIRCVRASCWRVRADEEHLSAHKISFQAVHTGSHTSRRLHKQVVCVAACMRDVRVSCSW